MVQHHGCKNSPCKCLRAYIRVGRTTWKPVGYYYTGCDKFDSDRAIEKRRKDPNEQKKIAKVLSQIN